MNEMDIGQIVGQYGFPIIAALGLGYFIYYIWTWVTEKVEPVVEESHMTLIALIDRVRMLDNDLIRLNTKLNMILQNENRTIPTEEEIDEIIKKRKEYEKT
jgi:hypothetical protein